MIQDAVGIATYDIKTPPGNVVRPESVHIDNKDTGTKIRMNETETLPVGCAIAIDSCGQHCPRQIDRIQFPKPCINDYIAIKINNPFDMAWQQTATHDTIKRSYSYMVARSDRASFKQREGWLDDINHAAIVRSK